MQLSIYAVLAPSQQERELLDGLLYELSALFPLSVLYEVYEAAINDADHSFWFIDLVAKKRRT